MTSSLVGSEMCIRDSLGKPLHRHWANQGECLFAALEFWQTKAPAFGKSCLLYTSDAADDM
eukprot:9482562-Prorocentrum_lima.AAC.1